MLVLSRKENQRIFVGRGIAVTVLKIRGDKVSLGFEAPKDVDILREEVAQRNEAEAATAGEAT